MMAEKVPGLGDVLAEEQNRHGRRQHSISHGQPSAGATEMEAFNLYQNPHMRRVPRRKAGIDVLMEERRKKRV